jgi:hypothetical protein
MTKKELIEKLKVLQNYGDTEDIHIEADRLLLEFIADEDIKKAYIKIPKWYA